MSLMAYHLRSRLSEDGLCGVANDEAVSGRRLQGLCVFTNLLHRRGARQATIAGVGRVADSLRESVGTREGSALLSRSRRTAHAMLSIEVDLGWCRRPRSRWDGTDRRVNRVGPPLRG